MALPRIFIIIAIITQFLLIAPHVHGEEDGRGILAKCKAFIKFADGGVLTTNAEGTDALNCEAYLRGFLDSHTVEAAREPKTVYCLPGDGVTIAQISKMVVRYLEENPDMLREKAKMAVISPLLKTFPCGNKVREEEIPPPPAPPLDINGGDKPPAALAPSVPVPPVTPPAPPAMPGASVPVDPAAPTTAPVPPAQMAPTAPPPPPAPLEPPASPP